MRLDRLLSAFFKDWSRTELVRGIKRGLVSDESGRVLRPSSPVKTGQNIYCHSGLAPSEPPPVSHHFV